MSHRIYLTDEKYIIYNGEDSILDCLERNNITSDYSCRGGFCGVCVLQKLEGETFYNQEPIYRTKEGEILSCCSLPSSDVVLNLGKNFLD